MKRYVIAGSVILLTVIGWIGVNSNAWQTYLIKRDLRSYGARLNDSETLSVIAQAFAYAGDSQLALNGDEKERVRALARILMACSRPDLIGKERYLEYR
jgi:biopolymer transport protein ExbB/TolQ